MKSLTKLFPALSLCLLLILFFAAPSAASAATPAPHWVGTWAASPTAARNAGGRFGAADTTLREIVHVSIGAPTLRIVLTNEFGTDSLAIGAADIALSAGGSSINPAESAAVTFGGRSSITIPPGALVVSDPIDMKLPAASDVAVSLFLPAQTISTVTAHGFADQTSYAAPGNVVTAKSLESPTGIRSWPFLKGIDVKLPGHAASIVAFGDSITDGYHSTPNANHRWPDILASRLLANKKTAGLGVLNEGISGNRVLHDRSGPSALARFGRDVIDQPGVKYVIIMESINDIGHSEDPVHPYDPITLKDLTVGLTQLAERAHMHGIKVFGATLTPYAGAKYYSPAGETMREQLNDWIRTSPQFDGVIDFDKTTRDPANPKVYLPADDSGDHLHPNDAGYKAMANAIDLKLFTEKK